MSSPEAAEASLQRTLKDLFSGAAGGVAQVLLGQLWIHYCCRRTFICFILLKPVCGFVESPCVMITDHSEQKHRVFEKGHRLYTKTQCMGYL